MTTFNRSEDLSLDEAISQKLQAAIGQIEQHNLSDDAKAIEQSFVYAEYGQINRAIQVLEKLRAAGNRNLELSLMIADLHAIKGSSSQAKEYYDKVVKLASDSSDPQELEFLIVAKAELASYSFQESQTELANSLFEEAKTRSQELKKQEIYNKGQLSQRLEEIFDRDKDPEMPLSWSNSVRSAVCPCPTPWGSGQWKWIDGRWFCDPCL
jgi:tetratricopeptide (TPR) repeat protein